MGGGGGGFLPAFNPSMWSARLSVAAAVLFVLALLARFSETLATIINTAFVFKPSAVLHGKVWQLIGYTIFDTPGAQGAGDVIWSLLTILFFWSFGDTVERQVGSRTFLTYVFGFSAAGAVLTTLISIFWPVVGGIPYTGLTVAFTALTIVFAELNPDTPILFGLLIPIAGRWLVWATLALLVLGALSSHPAAYLPHFGAFAAAEVSLRAGLNPRRWWLQFRAWQIERGLRRKARNFTVIPGEKDSPKPPRNGYLH
jgi:hypothetical protein